MCGELWFFQQSHSCTSTLQEDDHALFDRFGMLIVDSTIGERFHSKELPRLNETDELTSARFTPSGQLDLALTEPVATLGRITLFVDEMTRLSHDMPRHMCATRHGFVLLDEREETRLGSATRRSVWVRWSSHLHQLSAPPSFHEL
jgi:hypothetical protein